MKAWSKLRTLLRENAVDAEMSDERWLQIRARGSRAGDGVVPLECGGLTPLSDVEPRLDAFLRFEQRPRIELRGEKRRQAAALHRKARR